MIFPEILLPVPVSTASGLPSAEWAKPLRLAFEWLGEVYEALPSENVAAYVSGMLTFLVPLVLLLFERGGEGIDRNVIIRHVIRIVPFVLSSMLLILSALLWDPRSMDVRRCLCPLFFLAGSIAYLFLLLRVCRWLVQRKTDRNPESYANRLRRKYLHYISHDNDTSIEVWSRLLDWKKRDRFLYPNRLLQEFFEIYDGTDSKESAEPGMRDARIMKKASRRLTGPRKHRPDLETTETMLRLLDSKFDKIPEQAYNTVLRAIIPMLRQNTTDILIYHDADVIFSKLIDAAVDGRYQPTSLFFFLDQGMDVAGPDGRALLENHYVNLLCLFEDWEQARDFVMAFPEKWKKSGEADDPMDGGMTRAFQASLSSYNDVPNHRVHSPIASAVAERLFRGADMNSLAILLRFVSVRRGYVSGIPLFRLYLCQPEIFGAAVFVSGDPDKEEEIQRSLDIARAGWPRIFADSEEMENDKADVEEGIRAYGRESGQATELRSLAELLGRQLETINRKNKDKRID